MRNPRIYGDEARFRADLTRAIRSGEDLLAQADGYRKRMKLVEDDRFEIVRHREAVRGRLPQVVHGHR